MKNISGQYLACHTDLSIAGRTGFIELHQSGIFTNLTIDDNKNYIEFQLPRNIVRVPGSQSLRVLKIQSYVFIEHFSWFLQGDNMVSLCSTFAVSPETMSNPDQIINIIIQNLQDTKRRWNAFSSDKLCLNPSLTERNKTVYSKAICLEKDSDLSLQWRLISTKEIRDFAFRTITYWCNETARGKILDLHTTNDKAVFPKSTLTTLSPKTASPQKPSSANNICLIDNHKLKEDSAETFRTEANNTEKHAPKKSSKYFRNPAPIFQNNVPQITAIKLVNDIHNNLSSALKEISDHKIERQRAFFEKRNPRVLKSQDKPINDPDVASPQKAIIMIFWNRRFELITIGLLIFSIWLHFHLPSIALDIAKKCS